MKSYTRRWLALSASAPTTLCSFLLVTLAGTAVAPAEAEGFSYQERLKLYQEIEPMGETPFGEQIGLYTGSLSFNHTDIVLEGRPLAIACMEYVHSSRHFGWVAMRSVVPT